jgi:hypothetical protein
MSDVTDDQPEKIPSEDVRSTAARPVLPKVTLGERLRRSTQLRSTAVIVILAVAALAAVVVLVLSLGGQKSVAVAPSVETVALTQRVDALEQRVAHVEALPRITTATPAEIPAELTSRIATLENTVAALPKTAPAMNPQELRDMRGRVDAATTMLTELTGRLDAVELRGTGTPGAPVDPTALVSLRQTLAQLQQSLSALTARVDAVEKSEGFVPPSADLSALVERNAALEKRMNELESKDAESLTKRAATAVAVANLVRATQGSGRFKTELGALAMIAPDDPALVKLTPYAEQGLPTEAALAQRFVQLIPDIIRAEDLAHDSWWLERMWTNFLSLITVRRVGDQPGNDARAVVGRAELELEEHDLAGAVDEIRKLDTAPAEVARSWRFAAEARIALDKLVSDLNARLLADIATEN